MDQRFHDVDANDLKVDIRAFVAGADAAWQAEQAYILAARLKEHKDSKMEALFDLGMALRAAAMKAEEAAIIVDVPITDIYKLNHIMNYFEYDKDRYLAYIKERGIKSLNALDLHIRGKEKRIRPGPPSELRGKVADLVRLTKGSLNREDMEELTKMRDTIMRFIPPRHEVMDQSFLQYYDCVCCGAEPGEHGQMLVPHARFQQMKLPICRACHEAEAEPNYEWVALLYASYALITEEAYYRVV